jgi:hypothetical protein
MSDQVGQFHDDGEYITYVCDACIPAVIGAYYIRETAAWRRRGYEDRFVHPPPMRCVACGWVEGERGKGKGQGRW